MPRSQTHTMSLRSKYFNEIKNGDKKIEFRLLDDKRQKIKIGDKIIFTCTSDKAILPVTVTKLTKAKSFYDLIRKVPTDFIGKNSPRELLNVLRGIYAEADEKKLGVIGIFIKPD